MIRLYSYRRSSAVYRVRIALHLKMIEHEPQFVNLLKGEEQQAPCAELNQRKLVPALEIDAFARAAPENQPDAS